MRKIIMFTAVFLAWCVVPSGASAQTTNCFFIGNMMNCNTTGGMNSFDGDTHDESGRVLGEGVGSLIRKLNEDGFRKKIGRMLAQNDCEGAVQYAYKKGRLEVADYIRANCAPAVQYGQQDGLQLKLQNLAKEVQTPMAIDDVTTLSSVDVVGRQMLLMMQVDTDLSDLTPELRNKLTQNLCSLPPMLPLYAEGATLRSSYYNRDGTQIGSLLATADVCGVR